MNGATFWLYSMLTIAGQDATQERIPPSGLTGMECLLQLETREPWVMVTERGETVQQVYGCQQEEPLNPPENAREIQGMLDAAAREDGK